MSEKTIRERTEAIKKEIEEAKKFDKEIVEYNKLQAKHEREEWIFKLKQEGFVKLSFDEKGILYSINTFKDHPRFQELVGLLKGLGCTEIFEITVEDILHGLRIAQGRAKRRELKGGSLTLGGPTNRIEAVARAIEFRKSYSGETTEDDILETVREYILENNLSKATVYRIRKMLKERFKLNFSYLELVGEDPETLKKKKEKELSLAKTTVLIAEMEERAELRKKAREETARRLAEGESIDDL